VTLAIRTPHPETSAGRDSRRALQQYRAAGSQLAAATFGTSDVRPKKQRAVQEHCQRVAVDPNTASHLIAALLAERRLLQRLLLTTNGGVYGVQVNPTGAIPASDLAMHLPLLGRKC